MEVIMGPRGSLAKLQQGKKKKKKSLRQTEEEAGRVSLFGKDESSGIRGNITVCTSNLRANERFGIDEGPDASDI